MLSALPDWQTLSLPQQVAQMIVVRASGHLFDHQIQYPAWEPPSALLQHWVQDLGVGGVILLGGSAAEVGLRTQQLQDWAKIPLLIAADVEEGVGQRFAGATWFPPPLALAAIAQTDLAQAIALAERMGQITAEEALAIGINWVLAPVVDVNNNPANPVINVRSWGETPAIVSQLTTAFIRGAQTQAVLTSAKHFPGHGDTATDSHLELPIIPHSRARLEAIELPPFAAAIAQGVDSVMSAHLQIPAFDPDHPATFSAAILTGELRQRMQFQGLIVTDALIMGAITQLYGANEAAVLAIEAGADVLMMPIDAVGAIEATCAAVETGRIPLERIHASLERLWQAKRKVNFSSPTDATSGGISHAWEQMPSPPVQLNAIAQPQALATAAEIVQRSMQVYHPDLSRLRVPSLDPCRNLILVDDLLNCPFLGRQAPAIVLPAARGYRRQIMDGNLPILSDQSYSPTLLQLFVRSVPFRGSAGLSPLAQAWFTFLLETNQLQALVLYGSPYVLADLVPLLPDDVPYGFTYGQMPVAQTLMLEALWSHAEQSQMQAAVEEQADEHRAKGRIFTD